MPFHELKGCAACDSPGWRNESKIAPAIPNGQSEALLPLPDHCMLLVPTGYKKPAPAGPREKASRSHQVCIDTLVSSDGVKLVARALLRIAARRAHHARNAVTSHNATFAAIEGETKNGPTPPKQPAWGGLVKPRRP